MRLRLSSPPGRVRVAAALVLLLAAVAALGVHLATPHTQGLEADWSAAAVDGRVVAGRAVVDGHTALDLRTGKTVTLGSVRGGTPFVADERLVIASPSRVDSARLDATARWTWRATPGSTATPVAAASGSTLVLECPATGSCALVGLDARGRQNSRTDGIDRSTMAAPGDGSLPRVAARSVEGGGVLLTEPATGRTVLRAGRSFLATPDGPVVTELFQDGQCVVSGYTGADARWTRALGSCSGARPRLAVDDGAVLLTWPGRTERLDLATGASRSSRRPATSGATGTLLVQRDGVAAFQSRKTLQRNPFRWGKRVTVIQLRDARSDEARGQVVSDQPLTMLHLDRRAVVVRDGGRAIRYTVQAGTGA